MNERMNERLKLAVIRTDGGTQSRALINRNVVREYAEALKSGTDLGSVVVFHDGTTHWLADGFHRLEAHRQIGALEVSADVRQGTQRDAILYSVGANQTHGLRRTNADKRRAVTRLLKDEQWSTWTDRRIAEACGVSNNFVTELRAQVSSDDTSRRIGKDGKTYPAAQSTASQRAADGLERAYTPPPVRAPALPDSLEPEATGESIDPADFEAATAEDYTAATKALGEWVDHQFQLLAWFAQHNTTRLKRITQTQPALRSQLNELANTYHDTIQRIDAILDSESI
jgi:hypothetical protein